MLIIEPSEIALQLLEWLGIDFDAVYNSRGGIRRQQLILLNKINQQTGAKTNIYKTIHRLEASKNPQNIQWAKNVKNVLVGTVQASLMEKFENLSDEEKKKTKIKWIPSSARRPDLVHATYYGKVMTLGIALKRGLGLRYGCQCGFEVLANEETAKKIVEQFKKEVFKR
ncbi:hypothetical protein P7245_22425 [Vibrio parahaemolyticus]|nr:hypothetical protein [Vibrio parahaemolyticus]